MRWDKLFYDLESQLEGELNAEELDLGAEEERLRLGRLGLRERLEAVCGHTQEPVLVAIAGGERLRLRPVTIGRDWVSGDVVDDSTRARRCILPLASITAITLPRPVVKASLANARPHLAD